MKQLTCEMCGSTDLIKQDGFFVCQTCGCKYSVEEAKKMMIEGTVDIQGTVKVDNTSFVEKYLANARRAKQKEDWEETEKYYNMVEQNDPTNIEAIFYSAYGKAKLSLIDSDIYKRESVFKVLNKCVSIIDDNFHVDRETEEREIIQQICNDIIEISRSSYVYNQIKDGSGYIKSDDKLKTEALFYQLGNEMFSSLKNIINILLEKGARSKAVFYCQLAVTQAIHLMMNVTVSNLQIWIDEIDILKAKAKELDPSYEISDSYKIAITDGFMEFDSNSITISKDKTERFSFDTIKKIEYSTYYFVKIYTNVRNEVGNEIDRHMRFFSDEQLAKSVYNVLLARIQKHNPDVKKGGCYVATAVYGSYDCPEVWTLRRYRDYTLGSTWYGRAFIKTYYAISPTLVKWFGETEWFKKMWRGMLDRMVANLQEKGVENTPYEDKNW